jgi:hypothetical protein
MVKPIEINKATRNHNGWNISSLRGEDFRKITGRSHLLGATVSAERRKPSGAEKAEGSRTSAANFELRILTVVGPIA